MAFLLGLSLLLLIANIGASPLIESACEWRVAEDWGRPTYVNVATKEATYTKPTTCEPEPLGNYDPAMETQNGLMSEVTMQAQRISMKFVENTHKAWENIPSHFITLAIQADITRIRNGALNRVASQWQGPISVAVLTPSVDDVMSYMAKDASMTVKNWADVHAVVTTDKWKLYPINRMRNFSIKPVRTEHVMLLDIDEDLPYPMSRHLDHLLRAKPLFPERSIFVLASWQWAIEQPPKNQPQNIQELNALADRNQASIKHPDYPAAYEIPGINLATWRTLDTPREIQYPDGFEPYFIAKKKDLPAFDERFEGFGGDKSVFFLRVAIEKFHLVLLPQLFTWSSDSPSTSKHHAPNNNLQLMIKAWWELGHGAGCDKCYLAVCAHHCKKLFYDKDDVARVNKAVHAAMAGSMSSVNLAAAGVADSKDVVKTSAEATNQQLEQQQPNAAATAVTPPAVTAPAATATVNTAQQVSRDAPPSPPTTTNVNTAPTAPQTTTPNKV